jgi:tetratricopeptide (TPR) repeat protein
MLGCGRDAIEAYLKALSIDSSLAEVHNNLGLTYAGLGSWQEAVESYRQAIRLRSDFIEAINNLAETFCKMGRYQDEVATWKEVIRVKPDSALAYNNLGVAQGRLGHSREEIKFCKHAVKIKPDLAVAYYNLAVSYLLRGDKYSASEQRRILESLDSRLAEKLRNFSVSQFTVRIGDAKNSESRSVHPTAGNLPSTFDETVVGKVPGSFTFPVSNQKVNQSQTDVTSTTLQEILAGTDQ